MNKLSLGQQVYLKFTNAQLEPATVTKVGRVWVTLTTGYGRNYRAAVGHAELDGAGYSSPGTIWESEAAYEAARFRDSVWRDFQRVVGRQWRAPEAATPENVTAALKLLGLQ